jgi:hypothetical protein
MRAIQFRYKHMRVVVQDRRRYNRHVSPPFHWYFHMQASRTPHEHIMLRFDC